MQWQQHLEPGTPEARRLVREIRRAGRVELVRRTGNMTIAQCYSNVRETVAEKGGSAVLGWLLTWWPNHFAEAVHHAIWRTPDGQLEDVTGPAFPMMTGEYVSFVHDLTEPELSDLDPIVASTFVQLDRSPPTASYIKATREVMICTDAFISHCRKAGAILPGQVKGGVAIDASLISEEGHRLNALMADALHRKSSIQQQLRWVV